MATAMSQTPTTDIRARLHEPGGGDGASTSLPVTGELPAWLHRRARARHARQARGRRAARWTTGSTASRCCNRFGFADGRVSYASRFIEQRAPTSGRREGELACPASPPIPAARSSSACRRSSRPSVTDNPNVNLARIGERYIAMTETPMPVEFDPETLETARRSSSTRTSCARHVTTAHPHHDAERDELVNYVGALLARERVRALRAAGRRLEAARDRQAAGASGRPTCTRSA